jgi:hypothetical protein
MSVITNNLLLGEDGYNISRSVRLRSSASAYFNRTPASAGNQQKWTWSGWVKRGSFGQQQLFTAGAGTGGSPECYIDFEDNLNFQIFDGTSNLAVVRSTAVYRDPSAWYHVVVAIDTTQATAANRVLLYINGQAITSFAFSTYPTQNLNTQVNAVTAHRISSSTRTSAYYLDGYLTEVNFIDGQALTPSSFGETDSITGVWKAKKYAGTYGTNGFFLNFSDNSNNTAATIGKDSSGNGNNWTPNNISVTSGVTYDSMLDVPTMWADGGNGRGNYAVLSPTVAPSGRTTLSAANLQTLGTSSGESGIEYGTIQASSGKWYWECTVLALSTSLSYPAFGVGRTLVNNSNGDAPAYESGGAAIFTNGTVYKESSLVTTVSSYTTNDVIGIALDVDNLTCAFYKNGTLLTTVTSLTAGTYFATIGSYYNSSAAINFGQRPFTYTPPTGFKALNTQNLPDATIKKGNAYFDVSTWTGNGTSQSIVNSGAMQPDLVWAKQRSSTQWHRLIDAVRGSDKVLYSNDTSAEFTDNTQLTSFNSNGFSVGSQAGFNANAATYVGWQWKAAGSTVSNTSGSITSTVSANTTAGFSIVTYTGNGTGGATVGHGLGVAPKLIIIKNRGGASNWIVMGSLLGVNKYLLLQATNAVATGAPGYDNGTLATSSVFTIGSQTDVNTNGISNVVYCFADVAGYSAFGSYTGNGSNDGPFVYLGFRPRWVMVRRTDTTNNWLVMDTSRDPVNVMINYLIPNSSGAEGAGSSYGFDFLSNGFKLKSTTGGGNDSGGTYIYAAFAENPFKNSLAR